MELLAVSGLSIVCLAYSNTLNRWRWFQGPAYVPLNLVFAGLAVAFVAQVLGLSPAELGVRGDTRGIWIGAALGLGISAPAFLIAHSRHAHRIADRRVAGLSGAHLAYQVLVRVPLGTVLPEEILFRGVFLAGWRTAGSSLLEAASISAVLFGLWHIAPTLNLVRANAPAAGPKTVCLALVGAVAFTSAAGLALSWLRLETGGLAAPIALHAATNSLSTVAGVIAARRTAKGAGGSTSAATRQG